MWHVCENVPLLWIKGPLEALGYLQVLLWVEGGRLCSREYIRQ